jgi:hypothetical protein
VNDTVRLVGAIIVSLAFLVAGFYTLFHAGTSDDLQKAATGWLGLVLGFWLR